jgi:hypothetical protein
MKITTFFPLASLVVTFLTVLPQLVLPANSGELPCPDVAGYIIIGEAENVYLKAKGIRLQARIDTGAQTSSLGIASKQMFERDGRRWVQFTVKGPASEKPVEFEKPVVRIASIKRHGAESMERPVVVLKIVLGDVELEREFTLADRSKYTYPLLIGRNVLQGKYLVDVNLKYTDHGNKGSEE